MPKISDERRAARHAQILDAAWTCFQRQGLHATTMDDIIRASGLSAGAVYSYFPSKEELIFAAVTTSLAGLRDRVDALLDRPALPAPGALVREIALEVARFADRDDYDLRRVALLGWAETQRSERLRGVMRDAYLAFRGRLAATAESWTRSGVLPVGTESQAVAKLLLAQILGFVVQSAIIGDIDPADLEHGLNDLTKGRPAHAA